jgi:hypothetical protein
MRLAPPLAVQIHVLLGDIEPTEWRRLLVRREYHLGQLHHVIQAALGWRSSHPYGFHIGGLRCRDPEMFDLGRTDRDVGDARRENRRIRLREQRPVRNDADIAR